MDDMTHTDLSLPSDDASSGLASISSLELPRRKFLTVAALAGAGILTGSLRSLQASEEPSSLWRMPGVQRTTKAMDLPAEWVEIMGRPLLEYSNFLRTLRLKNITVRQIIEPHLNKKGDLRNTIPPRHLWSNIRKTLLVLDRVCMVVREPVAKLVSVYRSPAYNARCAGAARDSMHMKNNAVDVVFRASPGRIAEAAKALRQRGLFAGGIGRYYGFTHIDTRGENVDW